MNDKIIKGIDVYDAAFLILLTAKAFGFLSQTWIFVLLPVIAKLFVKFGRSWIETIAEDIVRGREKTSFTPEPGDKTEIMNVVDEEEEENK